MTEFNHALCEERHKKIGEEFKEMDGRLEKQENRFIAIMTMLIANLLGIAGALLLIIAK